MNRSIPVLWLAWVLASNVHAAETPQHQWTVQLPARQHAWHEVQRIGGDIAYEPVSAGDMVFVGCEHNGALLGLDLKTGRLGK